MKYRQQSSRILTDENYNRPDKKQVKPFMQNEEIGEGRTKDLYEAHHPNPKYWNAKIREGNKQSAIYRFLFPKKANWEVRHDPISDNQLRYKGDGFYPGAIDRSSHTWNCSFSLLLYFNKNEHNHS